MRQVVLDTETTGLEPSQGHRIIEIGCVEMVGRRLTGRHYHQYINPDREVDEGAIEVHGITNEFLVDKPRFHEIAKEFLSFIDGAELVIHNAPFDVGFIDHEFAMLNGRSKTKVAQLCSVIDSLVLARQKHPGQKNNLDALCKRYGVDNSQRDLHGALLDAEILADVYLLMTGGQRALSLAGEESEDQSGISGAAIRRLQLPDSALTVVRASEDEISKHKEILDQLDRQVGESCSWRQQLGDE